MGNGIDLNFIQPTGDEFIEGAFRVSASDDHASIEAFVDLLPQRLCEKMREAHFVAGCMAWFTNRRVLDRMAELPAGCQVVVQKEDFLRPDDMSTTGLRAAYDRLSCPGRFLLPLSSGAGAVQLSYCGDPTCEPVRCMGVANRGNGPRMHHKFFVFFKHDDHEPAQEGRRECGFPALIPYAVWTGSFNATANGERSRENAVFIRSFNVARFYADEWTRTLSLSESLNWESPYVVPDWRFGS